MAMDKTISSEICFFIFCNFPMICNVSFAMLNRWENNHTTPSRLARMRVKEYCFQKGISEDTIEELDCS